MMKQYSAISPRKNAQLSGKMWRSSSRRMPLPPRLVSSQRAAAELVRIGDPVTLVDEFQMLRGDLAVARPFTAST